MPDKCANHSRHLKIGLVLFGTNVPIVLLKKAGYIDAWFAHSMDTHYRYCNDEAGTALRKMFNRLQSKTQAAII